MKLAAGTVLFFLGFAQFSWGQTNGSAHLVSGDSSAPTPSPNSYVVFGASPQQEALVRAQIQIIQPSLTGLRKGSPSYGREKHFRLSRRPDEHCIEQCRQFYLTCSEHKLLALQMLTEPSILRAGPKSGLHLVFRFDIE